MSSQLPLIAATAEEWHAKPIPFSSTETLATIVADVLRFDDVLFREVTTTRGTFTIYAAYWRPGKIATQLVASHTPDRCWSEVGWKCSDVVHKQVMRVGHTTLRPAEARLFERGTGTVQYVLYWHLVGDEVYDYGDRFNNIPSLWRWWRDAARQVFKSPPAQYFVRLASDVPFERLIDEPAFRAVGERLADIGLAERP